MKIISLLLLFISTATWASSSPIEIAQQQALNFNKWYIAQFAADNSSPLDGQKIDKYVTGNTLKKLRHAAKTDEANYGGDFFIGTQDINDDWVDNVAVMQTLVDPVCTNVFVAFGKDKKHIVVDCMVKEAGTWKIQSVTGTEIIASQ
ncbi:DUF3828 domain-containing protein [Kosakonia sp. SMBL-WEM22]|uniref:DUF3828 domain-containing protein n=1 Tax=Kosakonia sp. SMBL-WEM22 TaxID=2725560 RepID=UPI001659BD13|nr:DUF3828 domain-containing protein [Kosakonia sp. SMBL-WEM22]MDV5357206.1 DUF3828 domain-containing protein [Enterobacter asburiae]QNQ20969.1 DUF3828 domain-containing protein [Kosakonia sp. SMBL-WEM22]